MRKFAFRFFSFLSRTAWSSPLAKSPFWAETFVRIGYKLRQMWGLAPKAGQISPVHGSRMTFGAASEIYGDMVNDRYEPEITRLFEKYITPGMTVIDIGAHIGYFTLLAARLTGEKGKVYAFEPDSANFSVLQTNINLNDLKNVTAVQKAVCDNAGTATFYLHYDTVAHSLHPTTLGRGKKTVSVETTSLDLYFANRPPLPQILIKMDIEGAELTALKGMSKLVRSTPEVRLIMEFVPQIQKNAGTNPRDLLAYLRSLGFRFEAITSQGLAPFDEASCDDLTLHANLFCVKKF